MADGIPLKQIACLNTKDERISIILQISSSAAP